MSLLGRCTHNARRLFLHSLFRPTTSHQCPCICRANLTNSTSTYSSAGFTPSPPPHLSLPPLPLRPPPRPAPTPTPSTTPSSSSSSFPLASTLSPSPPSPPPPTPKKSPLLKYPLGPRPSLRPLDRRAREDVYDTLLFLLRRQSGREYGLRVRDDGYLGVRSLLNYPLFRHMDLLDLQNLIEADAKYRFELRFDPSKGEEAWWVRAKLWDEKKYTLVPCRLIHGVRTVVYKTTLEEWNNHISRSGIPLLGNDFIQLDRTIKTPEYINTLTPQTHIFIFIDAQTALLAGLRFFFLLEISAHVGRHTPLLTRGNHLGLIPPSLFSRVSLVEATKTLVWSREGVGSGLPSTSASSTSSTQKQTGPEGNSTSTLAAELARFGHRPWPKEDLDITPLTGRRETYLPYLGREVHAFVDLPGEVFLRGGGRRGGGDVGGGGGGGGGVSGVASVNAGGVGLGGGAEGGRGEGGERAVSEAEEGTGRPARSAGWSGFLPVDERTVEEAREVLLSASSSASVGGAGPEGAAVPMHATAPSASASSPPSFSPPAPSSSPPATSPPSPPTAESDLKTLYTPTGLLKPFNPPPGSPVLEVPEPVPSEGSEFEFEYELLGGGYLGMEGKGGQGKEGKEEGKGKGKGMGMGMGMGKGKGDGKGDDGMKGAGVKGKVEGKVESKESAGTGPSPSTGSKKKKKKKKKAKAKAKANSTTTPDAPTGSELTTTPTPTPTSTSTASPPPPSASPSTNLSPPPFPYSSSLSPSIPSLGSTPPPETTSTSTASPPSPSSTPETPPTPTSPPSTKKETSKERNIRKREERRQRARERSLMARGAVKELEQHGWQEGHEQERGR